MEHSERPVRVVAQVVIAHLRQSVQALMDEDRVLPTDGWSLLSTLDRALNSLSSENTSAAGNAIGCFADRMQALTEAGVLETGDGRRPLETARAFLAVLRG
jgi:hypothetical protein